MSDRQPPSEWTVALVQGLGMLGLCSGGIVVLRGLSTGTIRPAEIAQQIPVWRDAVLDAVPVVLGSVAAVLVAAVFAVLAARHGRAIVRAWVAVWWRYQRRWAAVMADTGLTAKGEKGTVLVPSLHTVTTSPTEDVLTVAMLPGQTPVDWHHQAPAIAAHFGRAEGRIRLAADPAKHIDLVLSRQGRRQVEPLALPAPTPDQGIIVPPLGQAQPKKQLVAMRAWSLQIAWARVRVLDQNGQNVRPRWGARVRWETMDRTEYMVRGA